MRMLLLAGVQPDSGIAGCHCRCGRVHVAGLLELYHCVSSQGGSHLLSVDCHDNSTHEGFKLASVLQWGSVQHAHKGTSWSLLSSLEPMPQT